jgi:integrase
MTRRKFLSDHQVFALPVKAKRYFHPDPELRGHFVRIMPTGSKTYVATARDPHGKQKWGTIGGTDLWKIDDSRDEARQIIKRIKRGLEAKEPAPIEPDSFAQVAANWITRHVEKEKLITRPEMQRVLDRYILPTLGEATFTTIKRRQVADLLDKIEDKHGPRQADAALSVMRSIANWYATRDDDYLSPFASVQAKRMRRSRAKPRDRILDDPEIRTVWEQADDFGTFGAFVKILLLTVQRRNALRLMRWSDLSLSDDGGLIWTMPKGDRQKGNAGKLKLPALAVQIINALPRIEGNPFVFASDRTDHAMVGIGKFQNRFSEACALPHWTLHDLRRTARSLMARAGVNREIAEKIMGHALPGIEGTYNRFDYAPEKAHALAALAKLIEEILRPAPDKVVSIRTKKAAH